MGNCANALTTNKKCVHSSQCENNRKIVPITTQVIRDSQGKETGVAITAVEPFDEEIEFTTNEESPMPAPPVVMAETKKEKKDKVKAESEHLIAPSIVGVGNEK